MPEVEVAIVGGGPVGLGLAIDLGLRGVTATVLERTEQFHQIPKGQNLTQRTGEHFRAWSVTDAIQAATPIPRDYGNAGIATYGTLLSDYHYDWFQRSKVGAYYFALNERLPQFRMEQVLRDRLTEIPGTQLRPGCKVVNISQSDDAAKVHYLHNGSTKSLTAQYVVGCDGARSLVRKAAGLLLSTDHQGPRMALLVFRSLALDRLLQCYPGKSIYNVMNPALDGYWQFLGRVDLDGGWFYHTPVPQDAAGEDYFRTHLHNMVGAEFDLEFEHIGYWDLRISHATSYQSGRILIAGDAAHSHPPYGGYGVNTGLEDARNLSWKLAAHLQGWGGEGLLDSYSQERRPVFRSVSQDFIERMISDFRDFMRDVSPKKDAAAFNAAWAARAQGDDSDVTQFLPHYEGSSLVDGAPGAVSGAKGLHTFKARAGHHLAPQPMADGSDLWAVLGNGFTLIDLGAPNGLAQAFQTAAAARKVPFKIVDGLAQETAAAYHAQAILVRPDQFIAWVGRQGQSDVDAAAVLDTARGA